MDDVVGLVWTGLTYLRNRPRLLFTHFFGYLLLGGHSSWNPTTDLRKTFWSLRPSHGNFKWNYFSGGLIGNFRAEYFVLFLKNNPFFFSSLTRPLQSRESLGKITINDYLKITPGRSPASCGIILPAPCLTLLSSSSLLLVLNTPRSLETQFTLPGDSDFFELVAQPFVTR